MPKKKEFSNEEINKMQSEIEELRKQHNTADEVFSAFCKGFIIEETNKVKSIKLDTLQKWFSNPDAHMQDISNLLTYYYIIDGDIFQLYDLIFSLPQLNYKIHTYEVTDSYSKDMVEIKKALDKVKYKRLTRDLLVQNAHDGTVIGTWLGNAKNPYFYVFNDLNYCFPYGTYKGNMVASFDLAYLEKISSIERQAMYANLSPLVTENKYDKWKNEKDSVKKEELRYIILPQDRSLVARTHTLYRNQRFGIPHGTQALFDINHKQKMKELERSIADKVIRAIAVLKFKGKDDNDNRVSDNAKQKVFQSVKQALTQNVNKDGSIKLIAIPDFADYQEGEFKGIDEALDPKKYESIDGDVSNGIGISRGLTNGTKSNYATSQLNLELFYKRIGVMLEEFEEIFNQLIVILLGEKGYNYRFEFDKDIPLTKKDRIDTLFKLEAQGFSTKYVLQELGINFEEYLSQSIYEIEELKLRDKIYPPLNSNVISSSDSKGGQPKKDDTTNDNTITSKQGDGNGNPSPSDN